MENKNILISIIITTYNYEKYIEDAIMSILNQNFEKEQMEIIIVDDGSKDKTKEIVNKYKNQVTYIYQENKGQGAAFNTGINFAKGEIICLLDADDIWYTEKISKVLKYFIDDENVGVVRHWLRDIDYDTKIVSGTGNEKPKISGNEKLGEIIENRLYFIGTSGISFRKKYLTKILPIPEELTICPDEYLTTHILFYSKMVTIPEYLGDRRLHQNNFWYYSQNILNQKSLENHIKIRRLLDKYLKERINDTKMVFDNNVFFLSDISIYSAEIILNSLKGKKISASKTLYAMIKKNSFSLYMCFKYFFLLIAIISPYFYWKLYKVYVNKKILFEIRKKLLPKKKLKYKIKL